MLSFSIFSPKSPPNSPNPELSSFDEELRNVYINRCGPVAETHSPPNAIAGGSKPGNVVDSGQSVSASDLIWDWSSKPNLPAK